MAEIKQAEIDAKAGAYLRELSELGRKYGFGLNGDVEMYLLEPEDHWFDYTADKDGRVYFGAVPDAAAA